MAIVRDVYHVDELGRRMAMVTLVMLASPVIAPTLGAALLRFGWPAIFFFQAAYAGTLAVVLRAPRARDAARRLAQALRRHDAAPVRAGDRRRKNADGRRPVTYAITMALSASVFMTFITNSSFAYIDYFGVPAVALPAVLQRRRDRPDLHEPFQHAAPELVERADVLPPRASRCRRRASSVSSAVVLAGASSIWYVVGPIALIVAAFGLTGPSGSSQFIRNYDRLAGSASSLYTTLLFSTGAAFGAVSGVFFDGTLRPMVFTMFVATARRELVRAADGREDRPAAGAHAGARREPNATRRRGLRAGQRRWRRYLLKLKMSSLSGRFMPLLVVFLVDLRPRPAEHVRHLVLDRRAG